jgi:hypothetical protein
VDRLLGRAALAVDRHAGDVLGHAGCEPAGAGDVAGVGTDGVDVAEDHVVDGGGVDAGAVDQGGDAGRPEVGGVDAGEGAVGLPPAHGGADCVDDVGLGHGALRCGS